MDTIKNRLSQALKERNMTAAELARLSGLDKGSISRYLKGEFIPKQSSIGSMAKALRVSPSWLMGYDVPASDYIVETSTESILIEVEHYDKLSPENIEKVKSYVKKLYELQQMEEGDDK